MMLNVMWVGLPHGVCHSNIFFELKPWGKKPPGGLKYKQTKVQQNVQRKNKGF
jgi:hypothetical protein